VRPALRVLAVLPTIAVVSAALAGAWFVLLGGLLVEPVRMGVIGPCENGDEDCVTISCRFSNQSPLPTRGVVLLDVWTEEESSYPERVVPARIRVPVSMSAGEVIDLVYEVPGVRHVQGRTMVRCLPWFAGGSTRPGDESVAARAVTP